MISCHPISSSNLFEAYALVSIGFDLTAAHSERLYQLIIKNNTAENHFGYGLYIKGCIVGAIFTPIQGTVDSQLGASLILFYVLPAYRGVIALQFLSEVIVDMKQRYSFISDYTASKVVGLTLKSLGFIYTDIIYVTGNALGTAIEALKSIVRPCQLKNINCANNFLADGINYIPNPAIKSLKIYIPSCDAPINLFGFWNTKKRYLKYFHVVAADNEINLLMNMSYIQAAFMVNYKSLILVDASVESLRKIPPSRLSPLSRKCEYLFWSRNKSHLRVLALGSELGELA